MSPKKIILTIQDSFVIRGRGLIIIPRSFQSVTPRDAAASFSYAIELISADEPTRNTVASFQFEHFSIRSNNNTLSGRYSLVLLLAEQAETLPPGCQLQITEKTLMRMKAMVRNPQNIVT